MEPTRTQADASPASGASPQALVRDLALFQIKLMLDGFKDIVLVPLSIGAAVLDLLSGGSNRGRLFYAVLRLGEGFEAWLGLYSAAEARRRASEGGPTAPRGADGLAATLEAAVGRTVAAAADRHRARSATRGEV